jgi:hypothetical protein
MFVQNFQRDWLVLALLPLVYENLHIQLCSKTIEKYFIFFMCENRLIVFHEFFIKSSALDDK